MNPRTLRIHDSAAEEIDEAKAWYLSRSLEAARGFADEFDHALDRILANPLMWSRYIKGTRQVKMHRYPYLVIYKHPGSEVQIVAVAHTSRRPGYWAKRRFDTEAP